MSFDWEEVVRSFAARAVAMCLCAGKRVGKTAILPGICAEKSCPVGAGGRRLTWRGRDERSAAHEEDLVSPRRRICLLGRCRLILIRAGAEE